MSKRKEVRRRRGRKEEEVEMLDVLELIQKVEKRGFRVSRFLAFGPHGDDPITSFDIEFNPVDPSERRPVEEILGELGMKVTGGGTGFGPRMKLQSSDVSFTFASYYPAKSEAR